MNLMNLNRFKNILIVLLSVFALYQTIQLWFVNISDRNFFYTFLNVFNPVIDSDKAELYPYRVITNFGDNQFHIDMNNLNRNVHKADCSNVIDALSKSGEYVAAKELNWVELLEKNGYIYDFNIDIPSEIFSKGFFYGGGVISSRLKDFDSVLITPDSDENKGEINIVFISISSNHAYEFTLKDKSLNSAMLTNIELLRGSKGSLIYMSSALSGYSMFDTNIFIPIIPAEGYDYTAINIVNPYVDGEKHIRRIEKNITHFFENPSAIWSDKINDVYTFSDKSIVVKYFNNDVIEYNNFNATSNKINTDFITDYSVAFNFIKSDIHIGNEFYLAKYTTDNKSSNFYFNYTINDLPINLTSDFKNELEMEFPVEITVSNGQVIRYKKLAYVFKVDPETKIKASLDFLGSLSSIFISDDDIKNSKLNNTELAFRADKNKQMVLYWFLNLNDVSFARSAQ